MSFDLASYTIRRKVLKIFGASFHIFDDDGNVVGFSRQKAFKLKEDIRVYRDESMDSEILVIKARQVIDFSAAYDIVDGVESRKVGAARRKGFSSLVRDSWEILDESDKPIAGISEDSLALAMARRALSAVLDIPSLIPQKFSLASGGRVEANFKVHFNPFVYRLSARVAPEATLDRRLILGAAVLLAAIEGRQR